jgi:hypothetical protein
MILSFLLEPAHDAGVGRPASRFSWLGWDDTAAKARSLRGRTVTRRARAGKYVSMEIKSP